MATKLHPAVTSGNTAPRDPGSMHIEIRGEATPDLASLASLGDCPACLKGTCSVFPAYLRISYDRYDQDADLTTEARADRGVVRQAQAITELAAGHGGAHVVFFVDNDMSASKVRGAKAQWWVALDYVRAGRPAWFYGIKGDRLGRRLADLETLDDIRAQYGTRVWTLAEGDLFANAAWPFMAAMAKVEASQIAWRVRRAQDSRANKNLDRAGGRRPYGFADDRLEIIWQEAAVIEEAARRILAGDTASAICRDLTAWGIPRPCGDGEWAPGVLRAILASPRYAGLRVRNEGTRKERRYEVVGTGAWPALLDLDLWHALQTRLADTACKRGHPVTSLLGGIARCGVCGAKLHAGKAGGHRVYRCNTSAGGCGGIARRLDIIDAYVLQHALGFIAVDVSRTELDGLHDRADQLATESTELDLRVHDLRQRYARRTVSAADFFATLDTLNAELKRTNAAYTTAVARIRDLASDSAMLARWDSMNTDQQRAFLARHCVAIVLHKPPRGRSTGIRPGEIEIIPRTATPVAV